MIFQLKSLTDTDFYPTLSLEKEPLHQPLVVFGGKMQNLQMEHTKHLWIRLCGSEQLPGLGNYLGNHPKAGHGEFECTGRQSQFYTTYFLDV